MNREEAKELFRNDKDAYGKPKSVMKKIDMIFDDFEKPEIKKNLSHINEAILKIENLKPKDKGLKRLDIAVALEELLVSVKKEYTKEGDIDKKTTEAASKLTEGQAWAKINHEWILYCTQMVGKEQLKYGKWLELNYHAPIKKK